MTLFLLGGFLAAMFSTTGLALTVELEVTPAYVREHPNEWSVKVAKNKDGLIAFTIVRTLSEPKYLVAHLAVRHAGKLIATSDTPVFGKPGRFYNTFHVSISPEDVADSEFVLGESGLSKAGVPVVGTMDYKFRLSDFVPTELLRR